MPETKMSAEEMKLYYQQLHRQALAHDPEEKLGAVTDITANRWVNNFTDYAHRLGMRRAFRFLESQWGLLRGRAVLDLGCGRGRWSKEYAARGAQVTGVDISPDAISLLAEEMPEHQFICQDIPELNLPPGSFDIVSSVTVLQHMPQEKQQLAFSHMAEWIKSGGYLVLLENVMGFDAPHVFPHRADEWITMVEAAGLKRRYDAGSNYELLFRIEAGILRHLRGNQPHREAMIPTAPQNGPRTLTSRLKSGAKTVVAGLSYPTEWLCHKVHLATPTHRVMIFSK
jgi:SAM-dependent methyltransferase